MGILTPEMVWAQKDIVHFENIGRENGLAQGTITGIVEGKEGFLWFGTAEGLHRYDGYQFKIYKHVNRDDSSLSNNHITSLFEDKAGYLWVGTYSGEINRFDKVTQNFDKFPIIDTDSSINKYPVNCIYENNDGRILIGLDGGGMSIINVNNKSVTTLLESNSPLPNNYVHCFSPEANGLGIWVGTERGLILYNNNTFKEFKSLELFSNQFVNDILHYKSMVYVATNGQGLQIWDTRKDIVQPIPSPRIRGANFTNFVIRDNVGNLWIGTDGGGLMKFNGDKYVSYRNNPFNFRSIIGDDVKNGLLDKQGILWFGCRVGISKFDPNLQIFNLFETFEIDGKATNNNVYSIYETKDKKIWLGTLGSGLSVYDPKSESIEVYNLLKDPKTNVETKAVAAIFEDRDGTLWVGSRDEGLFSFDRTTKNFTHHPPKNPSVKPNTIRHIMQDSEGKLWLSTRWGLVQYLIETGEFKVYSSPYLNNNPIYKIIENKHRNELILVTFRAGVQIFHKDNNTFTVLQHGEDSTSPSVNSLMCIEPLGHDSFLIGTYGGGLNIFDREKLEFKSITTENGLPNDVVYGILPADGDTYWLSTNDGLVKYNRSTGTFKQYTMSHYLQGLEFNEGAYWKSSTGTLYFGGPDGFNFFQSNPKPTKSKPPKVVLTSFQILENKVEFDKDINHLDQVEIKYNEDLISFEFAALSFTNSSENIYEYQLQGYDEKWINSGKRRVAYYGHLSPGSYTFKVKGATHDGVWSKIDKVIRVVVQPPYWQTWWFKLLMVVLAIAVIGLIFFIRTKTLARSYQHQMVDLELKALRSQMNPHFIFNSLNSIQYFVLKNEPKTAYTYLTKFSSLMRMILSNSSLKHITIQAELDWLETYLDLEKVRLENQLEYKLETRQDIDKENTMIPSMLIQPYVENAIIHGLLPKEHNRQLRVTFSIENEQIHCLIEDNGIGRVHSKKINAKRTKKYKSQGIKLTGERLAILTQNLKIKPELKIIDLYDEQGNPTGTQVRIVIPILKKSKYDQD
jgi:ligand-binding sensor domain-containing protein